MKDERVKKIKALISQIHEVHLFWFQLAGPFLGEAEGVGKSFNMKPKTQSNGKHLASLTL